MSQAELDQQVSRLTGESLREVRRRGFSILTPELSVFDPEDDEMSQPQILDWDDLASQRYVCAA